MIGLLADRGGGHGAPSLGDLPHGPLTRLDFVMAKIRARGHRPDDKNGELGDAAAGSDRYDVLRYDLDLTIDPETADHRRHGEHGLRQPVEADLTDFVFDLRYTLNVDGVDHLTGALAFTHDADSVSVVLPHASGHRARWIRSWSATAAYPGAPDHQPGPDVQDPHPPARRSPEDTSPIIANMSQPGYAQSWWPCKDKPGDKFLVSMKLTVPDNLIGVSNGTLVSETPAEPGWKTYAWREDYPIATYLVSVAISDYVLLEEDCTTAGLGSFVPLKTGSSRRTWRTPIIDFEPLCDMMDFCESRFGPYPFLGEKYGHAEFIWPGAMEHQTVTSIGHGSLDGDGTHDWLVMHELAHQWFGDSLTPGDLGGHLAERGLRHLHRGPVVRVCRRHRRPISTFMDDHRNEVEWTQPGSGLRSGARFSGPGHLRQGRLDPAHPARADGRRSFFGLVKEWADGGGRPGGNVVTQEFIDLASIAGPARTLDDFLWPYLNETDLPQIVFDYEVGDGTAGADTRLTVTLQPDSGPSVRQRVSLGGDDRRRHRAPSGSLCAPAAHLGGFEFAAPVTGCELDPRALGALERVRPGPESRRACRRSIPTLQRAATWSSRYKLDQPRQVVVRVMDAMGRQVFHRDLGTVSPDPTGNEYGWDVRTGSGAQGVQRHLLGRPRDRRSAHVRKFAVVR